MTLFITHLHSQRKKVCPIDMPAVAQGLVWAFTADVVMSGRLGKQR